MSKPQFIRIVNDSGVGHKTKIFYGDTDISGSISDIELTMRVGELNTAKLTAVAVNGEMTALLTELREKVVPPPLPVPELSYTVFRPCRRFGRLRSRWRLTRHTPVGDLGTLAQTVAEGWGPPVGPLKIVQPE